jgi:hypothetical protein
MLDRVNTSCRRCGTKNGFLCLLDGADLCFDNYFFEADRVLGTGKVSLCAACSCGEVAIADMPVRMIWNLLRLTKHPLNQESWKSVSGGVEYRPSQWKLWLTTDNHSPAEIRNRALKVWTCLYDIIPTVSWGLKPPARTQPNNMWTFSSLELTVLFSTIQEFGARMDEGRYLERYRKALCAPLSKATH